MGGLLFECSDDTSIEGEVITLFLALFDAINVGFDEIIDGADFLVDLAESIMTDDGESSEPEDEGEVEVILLFGDEVVPAVHGLICCI